VKKIISIGLLVVLLLGGAGAWWFWNLYYKPNVHTPTGEGEFLYVHTGTNMPELVEQLYAEKFVSDTASFRMIADLKKFTVPRPGRYRIKNGMNNRELVNLLRAGIQEPLKIVIRSNMRTKEQLAGRVGKLEADSSRVLLLLNDPGFLSKYGMTPETILTMFIPDTYEFNWNTSEEEFFDRMAQEYKKFWTDDRRAKARALGLSQSEVVTLASLVEAEQSRYADERPAIAGLYINRLRKRMPLQSDPTIIYALGDFTITRVLSEDLKINSPYNTYMHTGLPPGPIRIPEAASVDAVLDYKESNYLYMCAEFGTGRHKFTHDYDVHCQNAREFQRALDKASIKR
jgi:UPF0755 protein